MYLSFLLFLEFPTGLAYSAKNNKIRDSPPLDNGLRTTDNIPHMDGIPSPVIQKKNLHHTKSAPPVQYSRSTTNLRRQVQFNAKK